MATKVTKPEEAEEKMIEKDPWAVMMTVRVPRDPASNEKTLYVGINGRDFLIPRGKSVEVPLPVYNAILMMEAAEEAKRRLTDDIPND